MFHSVSFIFICSIRVLCKFDKDSETGLSPSLRTESVFERHPEVSVDLQEGEFLGPLQYRTWRRMNSGLQPGITTAI
jgi:hypothetical protein